MIANALSASPMASKASPFMSKARAVLTNPYFWLMAALFLVLLFGAIEPAHAADATEGGGSGLPWEGPLTKLKQSISGPVAFVIALLGIVGIGRLRLLHAGRGADARRPQFPVRTGPLRQA